MAGVLVDRLAEKEGKYQEITIELMLELAKMDDFPNLRKQEDSEHLIAVAVEAIINLRKWTAQYSEISEAREKLEREQAEKKLDFEARRSHERVLDGLKQDFMAMYAEPNAQKRGRAFESLLNELFALFDLNPRRSFVIADEQIDGAFTFNTDDYIVEAKWEKQPAARADVGVLSEKVRRKGKNTLGLFVAVSGFSEPAVNAHSECGSGLVFLDGADLFSILDGRIRLDEALDAKRRHFSETGRPYLMVKDIVAG